MIEKVKFTVFICPLLAATVHTGVLEHARATPVVPVLNVPELIVIRQLYCPTCATSEIHACITAIEPIVSLYRLPSELRMNCAGEPLERLNEILAGREITTFWYTVLHVPASLTYIVLIVLHVLESLTNTPLAER
jgi:hypothetical protein